MNEKALLQKIQTLLRARQWPGGSNKVFAPDSVKISIAPALDAIYAMVMPACIIKPLDATNDDEEPQLATVKFSVTPIVMIAGDAIGETTLVGANRADATKSEGAGLLDVAEQVLQTIEILNADEEVIVHSVGRSRAAAEWDSESGYTAWREYIFAAEITSE